VTRARLARARAELADQGWTLIPRAPFLRAGRPEEQAVLDLAAEFGVPSARDGGRAVWPVAPAADGRGCTFSSRVGRAGFHTDAQYRAEPEDYMCLFGVRPAADGGRTGLLRYDAAIEALMRRPDGSELLAAMRRPVWRWRIPACFAAGGREDGAVPPAFSPPAAVLPGTGRIRWRRDNLDPRCDVPPGAAARIDRAFETAPGRVRLRLGAGDLLVVDNHRVMHARTAFADPDRFLLRVRLWEAL
jgi:Taurine catabolism dioxygenase TauD, TfdA family